MRWAAAAAHCATAVVLPNPAGALTMVSGCATTPAKRPNTDWRTMVSALSSGTGGIAAAGDKPVAGLPPPSSPRIRTEAIPRCLSLLRLGAAGRPKVHTHLTRLAE